MATDARLLPVDDDLDTGGFFEAARRGELAVRRCNGCDAVLHVPRAYCRHCGSWEGRWEVVDGAATLHSWTVVTHQVHPAYPVPYTVVLVDLDALPGTRLVGSLDGDHAPRGRHADGGVVRRDRRGGRAVASCSRSGARRGRRPSHRAGRDRRHARPPAPQR